MQNKIGFMQGRLVASEKKNKIQYFPEKNWKLEIFKARKNNIKLMEWTINIENIKHNPLIIENIFNSEINFLKKSKIQIESVTCDFFMQKPFFKKKYFKDKKKITKYLNILIKHSEILGIKYIVIPLVDNSSIKSKNEEKIVINYFSKIQSRLKKLNILFESDYKPIRLHNFIKKFDKEFFGINYDTGNSAALGYDIEEEYRYFKYVKNIHIKDRRLKSSSVRLGDGDVNFKAFFKYLKKSKYKGNLILQTARVKSNQHLNEIKKNIKFVQSLL